MSKGFCFAAFLSGVIAGAAAGWQYAKRKYERIAQEEIDSVKKAFSKREQKPEIQDIRTIPAKKGKEKMKWNLRSHTLFLQRNLER